MPDGPRSQLRWRVAVPQVDTDEPRLWNRRDNVPEDHRTTDSVLDQDPMSSQRTRTRRVASPRRGLESPVELLGGLDSERLVERDQLGVVFDL